jgi:hypothetical protein
MPASCCLQLQLPVSRLRAAAASAIAYQLLPVVCMMPADCLPLAGALLPATACNCLQSPIHCMAVFCSNLLQTGNHL